MCDPKTKLLVFLISLLPLTALSYTLTSTAHGDQHIYPSGDCLSLEPTHKARDDVYDQYPYAVTYYYGVAVSDAFGQIITGNIHRFPEDLQSLEIVKTLSRNNIIRRFFYPVVGVVQIAANFAIRYGKNQSTIYEVDPYIGFRWANWPWNHYVTTSFVAGEGVSYVTSVPYLEKKNNDHTKRLLNYMMLEAAFAPPSYPRLQLVVRLHHRSGAYGLYHAGNTGSNILGLGIQYLW